MTNQQVFLQLVKQDMKRRKRRSQRIPRQWVLAYIAVIALIAFVAATYGALRGNIEIHFTWFFTLALPFAALGITISLTVREWKNNTVGWWLSLPFSRRMLVVSKFCAGLIRSIIVFVFVYVAVALFALYMMILSGDFQPDTFLLFLKRGLEWFVLLASTFPFMAALGLLFGVFRYSRAKPIFPLFWIFWFLMWGVGGSTISSFFTINENTHIALSITMFYPIAASWIAAYLMIRLSAYLLDRQLAL